MMRIRQRLQRTAARWAARVGGAVLVAAVVAATAGCGRVSVKLPEEIGDIIKRRDKKTPKPPAPQPARLDYSRLKLKGNGHRQDSFSLVVQAAAGLLGRAVAYEKVLATSCNGFAPGLRRDESCTAWWNMYERDRCMDLVARRLGLTFRQLPEPPNGRDLRWRNRFLAPYIREAMDAGEVVITDGGWQVQTPGGINPWCWWGILTEADPDGTIRGACLNGRRDNLIEGVYTCWALSAARPSLTNHQADLEMLDRAVARIRGDRPPFLPGKVVFGRAAMALWIAQLDKVPFCPDCKDQSWTCAVSTAEPVYSDSKVVAAWLRSCRNGFAVRARPHIEAAAGHYEQIAELLRPAVAGRAAEHYRAIIGDRARQRAHAHVIARCSQELDAAAEQIELALIAERVKVAPPVPTPRPPISTPRPHVPIPPAPEPVRSARVKGIPAGNANSNSLARALAMALTAAGTKADYDTTMGDLGLAFLIQAERGRPVVDGAVDVGWWPLGSWGAMGRLEFLSQTLGRGLRVLGADEALYRRDPAGHYRTHYLGAVQASIAAGTPVVGRDDTWWVISGYDEKDPPVLGCCALSGKSEYSRMGRYPWAIITLGDKTRPMDRRQADLQALLHAVALARGQTATPAGGVTGRAAYVLWAAALRDTARLGQARWHANMCLHLGLNRRSAVAYLRAMARRHPKKTADHLTAAAKTYDKLLAELRAANTGAAAMKSKVGREKLADLTERLAALDDQAADELADALTASGVKVPPAPKVLRPPTRSPIPRPTQLPSRPPARAPVRRPAAP